MTTTTNVRVGCSGWQYRDWRGLVYPEDLPARRWFECYAQRFDTVELNSTFYRLPSTATVERWAAVAPADFEYAVKVGAFASHRRKLRDPGTWLPNHLDRVGRLGDALGPNVVQLPPRWERDVGRLEAFLEAAPRAIRWAVELRDPTWLHDDVYEALHRHGAALVMHDLLPRVPALVTAQFVYLRFHGPDALRHPYHGRYGPDRLRPWADRCAAWSAEGVGVHAFFNNDVDANAVADATSLRDAIGRRLGSARPSSRAVAAGRTTFGPGGTDG